MNVARKAFCSSFVILLGTVLLSSVSAFGQTASTGALAGTVVDPSGAVVADASVKATNTGTGDVQSVSSHSNGSFLVPLLQPGTYDLAVSKAGFKTEIRAGLHVHVTDTEQANVRLQVGDVTQTMVVTGQAELLNTQDTALGHVTNQQMVEGLPLVNRNYTQILGLSPGVVGPVDNASDLGQGGSSFNSTTQGVSAHGGATNDNNFQMNGVEVDDLMGSGIFSGGVPVPNPDSIEEFKVQTGQYDASYGRNAGANVDVITKSGSNSFHGDVFEFVRNDIFNANDFFLNEQGEKRGVLKQNQFGFTLGGPIKKDKLLFFTSYQGTRQINGLDSTAACLSSFTTPTQLVSLGSDRSRAALGAAFAGQASAITGVTIAADGSNISAQALALLNTKLANGNYLIPSPQNATTGLSSVTQNCTFNDDQFVTNLDYLQSSRSTWSGRFFFDDNSRVASLPANQLSPSAPGFSQPTSTGFRNVSLTNTYTLTPTLLNQLVIGYNRMNTVLQQDEPSVTTPGSSGSVPFTYSDIGTNAPGLDNVYPSVVVYGSFALGGNGQGLHLVQNSYNAEDSLSYTLGKHSLRFGGGASDQQINFTDFHYVGYTVFLSFTDLLLGSPFEAVDYAGLPDRAWRAWNGDAYVQDDYRVTQHLTLNLGFRYERQGAIGDAMGRASILNLDLVDPTPPASGTLAGYTVASNFKGTLPAGVTRASNNAAIDEDGQNNWAPRVGFAWQPSTSDRFVLRGGYGIYFSRTAGQPFLQLLANPPFGEVRTAILPSFSNPFAALPTFPSFQPYSPTTSQTPTTFSAAFRPPIVQEYSFNLQTKLSNDLVLEIGVDGSRGTHLLDDRYFDQALSASSSNPIRGATDNTAATLLSRTPYQGFLPAGANIIESEGTNWYNALEVSLNKRFSKGLQFLASYSWAKDLSADNGYTSGANGGTLVGDQNNAQSRYGNEQFVRPHRFVASFVYDLPGPHSLNSLLGRVAGGWTASGVVTVQAGDFLTILDSNSSNAFGLIGTEQDRAEILPGCSGSQLLTSGPIGHKLNNYFNAACFTGAPVVASDGSTGFGNSGNGILLGPGQYNVDVSAMKRFGFGEGRFNLTLRGEFFNAFNTAQFSDPNTNAGTVVANPGGTFGTLVPNATFGEITTTSVNPRVVQLAAKLTF